MSFKHSNGLYEIEFDTSRRISREKMSGFWKKEDIDCLQKDYQSNLPSQFKGNDWAICCDLRNYKTSSINDEMNKHVKWKMDNGLRYSAIVVNDVIVKMQLNNVVSNKFEQKAFTSFEEADNWLKSKGF